MTSSRQSSPKKITPFEINGVTYRYRIGGIMFADTAEAAVRGYQALMALPEHSRGLLIKGAKNGLFVGAVSALETTEFHTHDVVVGGYQLRPEVLNQIASGELRIDGRAPAALKSDQITFDDVTLTFSVVPDADMTRLSLLHEVDHHLRLHSGLMAARQMQEVTGIRRPPVSFANALDPTFYTALRTELHRTYFESITTYLRNNQLSSIQQISPFDRVAANLFRKPIELYFVPNVLEGYATYLMLSGREFHPESFNRIMLDTEARWYAGQNPVSSLVRDLHALHPDLPGGRTAIRYIVSNAARSARSELGAHFSEACAIDQAATQAMAPNLYPLMNRLTNERYGLLGFTAANASNAANVASSPTVRQLPYQSRPQITYRAPQQISYHQRPQIGYTPPRVQAAEPVVEVLRKQPNIRFLADTITIDAAAQPGILNRLKRVLPYLRQNGWVLAQRGLYAANVIYNIHESGSIPAGIAATRMQMFLFRAAGSAAIPINLLMISDALPDAMESYNQALEVSSNYKATLHVLTPSQKALNSLSFRSPYGAGRGLISDDMDTMTRVRIAINSDPERLDGLGLQRIGRFFNNVFSMATRVTIGIVKASNPFSMSKLDAPEYHRELPLLLPQVIKKDQIEDAEPEIIEIAEGVDDCARQASSKWPAFFHEFDASVPSSGSAMGFANQQVRLMDCSNGQMTMHVGMGNAVMTPEFHQFLNNLNTAVTSDTTPAVKVEVPVDVPEVKVEQNKYYGTQENTENKKDDKPAVPLISNVGIGKVGDRLGVIATIAGIAQVGVAADKAGGFLVLISAEFGPQFWSAMGAGIGVGAAVAAALLVANIFISKHQKHVASKINSGVKRSNKDGEKINEGLQKLFNDLHGDDATRNLEALIKQTESLIGYVRTRIDKEEDRGDYARSHGQNKAKKAHRETEKAYKGIVFELSTLRQSLQQEQVQLDFIKQHAAATSEELVGLAKGLIVKFGSTDEAKDVSDKESQLRDPYARLQELHNQGYRLYVHVKDDKGRGHTKGHHLTLAEANQHMLTRGTIEAKKSGDKDWIGEAKTTYSKTELSNITGLRILIVNKVLELVQEGRADDAKDLLKNSQDICPFGTSAADLKLSGLSTLLDRLTLAGQSTPAFWLGELERVRTGAVVMNDDEKMLLKSRAAEQLLGHVISNAVSGNFESSKSFIEGMKKELSDLNATTDKISAKLDALKPIIGDVDQCIAIMKANTQDQSRTQQLDNVIEDAALAFAVKKDIFAHAAENRLDKAEQRAAEFAEASPDNAESAKSYAAGIAKLKQFHEKPNKELLSALEENAKAKTDIVSGENEIVSSTLTTWIYDGIFKSVVSGDTDSAVRDLNQLEKQDKSQAALCQRLVQTITTNADVAKRSEAVLLDEYSALLEKQQSAKRTEESEKEVENPDPHAVSALAMEKSMVLGALLGNAFDKGRRGYNREAAESLAELRRRDASLKLSTQEEDFRFSHHEQLIGVCIKPVQDVAMRFVRGYKPSAGRSIALGALELTTTVQIIAPSSLSLALQFAHAKYTLRDVAPAIRNKELVQAQLLKDILPFAKGYNPLNPENYFNGAMIYTQLALKGVEHLPLSYVVSPKNLHRLEGVRASVLNYGHKSIRTFSTVTAAMQLRTAYYSANGLANLANAPMLACTVANAVFDAGCWLDYQSKAKQGKAPEYPEYYQAQEGVRSAFDTISTFTFVAWITGGIGAVAWAIGAAKLTQSAYVVTCESTRIDINTKAMMAACSNVGYFRNIQYELQRAASADKDSKVTVPVMYEYTSSVIYLILKDKPTNGILDAITDGTRIAFTEEEAHYYLYFRNDLDLVETISLANRPAIFDELKDDKSSCAIARDSEHFQKLSEFASACIVSHYIANSAISIEKRLDVFGGLAYVSGDKEQEAANVARITHLKQKVKNDYDAANHDAVLEATKQVPHQDTVLINPVYLIPPHAAWDLILFYRLTTFIQSPKLLMQFRDEYETCSKLIYDSAKTDPAWYQANKDEIKKSMEQIVCYARQQMIDAAQRAETKQEKLAYLALMMQSYHCCKDWDIMLDDDFKFAAAAIYSKLEDHDKTTLFMERIRDLTELLCKKNNGALTADALTVLDQLQSTQYNDILFRAARGELPVDDEQLLVNALNLIEKKKYDNASEMLANSRDFLGKGVALAKLAFVSSHLMSLQQSLQLLSKEKSRSLHYWILLESLIQRFYESTKYIPDAMKQLQIGAKLCGWRKVCLDYIYKFDLDERSRADVDRIQSILTHQVRYYLAEIHQKTPKTSIQDAQRQYREFIDAGHQAMRGENNMNIFDELQSMMHSSSYTCVENNERHRYLPLEVPPDGDCGLHVFGISRKDAINLLMQHVQAQEWTADLGNTPNVYTILLNDLEFTNNARYERSILSFNANKKMVIEYLNLLSKPKYWLPHNQASESVLDALAFALGNNLRVFVSDAQGRLQLSGMNIYNNEFPTIDILYTSADGFSADGSGLNHYIRLQKLSSNVVELVTEQSAAQRPPQWSQSRLFRRKVVTTVDAAPAARNEM